MAAKLLLTGGSGFLGQQLRAALARALPASEVVELTRRDGADLLAPASYARLLDGVDTVVHAAAATGRATAAEHVRINAEGTRSLVAQSERAGVRRFVYVSSIAAGFPDVRRYPYAQSKQAGEAAVASSRLSFTIVRPTIIAGRGSAVLQALGRLAGLPVVPVFGSGTTRVQPIYVSDAADAIAAIVRDASCAGETVPLGGPDVVSIEELLRLIHRTLGRGSMRAVHVPLRPLLAALTVAETVVYRWLPLTVGQLATFRFDGTAPPHPSLAPLRAGLVPLSRMIELSLGR